MLVTIWITSFAGVVFAIPASKLLDAAQLEQAGEHNDMAVGRQAWEQSLNKDSLWFAKWSEQKYAAAINARGKPGPEHPPSELWSRLAETEAAELKTRILEQRSANETEADELNETIDRDRSENDRLRNEYFDRIDWMRREQCWGDQNLGLCKCGHPYKWGAIWEKLRDGKKKYGKDDNRSVYERFATIMLATCKRFGKLVEEDVKHCDFNEYVDCTLSKEKQKVDDSGPIIDIKTGKIIHDPSKLAHEHD